MDSHIVKQMRDRIESLAVLSTTHLSSETRKRLLADDLSVNAHSNEYGGFVYVGEPGDNIPSEPDLAEIFKFAAAAGICWLKFDSDGAEIDGLPTFSNAADFDLGE